MNIGTYKCKRCEWKYEETGLEHIHSYEYLQRQYGERFFPDKPFVDLVGGKYMYICPKCNYYVEVDHN